MEDSEARIDTVGEVQWHSVNLAPLILISGKETILIQRALERIKELARAQYPELEVRDFDARAFNEHDLGQYTAPSLFLEPKLILLEEISASSESLINALIKYFLKPEQNVILVLINRSELRQKKLLEAFKKTSYPYVNAQEIKKLTDKYSFATSEFARAKTRITDEAIKALVEAYGNDLMELAAVCQQLISDSKTQPKPSPITLQEVVALSAGRFETTAFAIADAALAGNQRLALTLLRQAELNGLNANLIVATFATKLREIAKVTTPGMNAKSAGIPDWKYRSLRSLARNFSDQALANSFDALASTDAAIKGAEKDPKWALQRFVIKVSNAKNIK